MSLNFNEELSLYFHIPFCTKKCSYCHFYVLPDKAPLKVQLMEGFKLEWEHWLPKIQNRTIKTVYFGGGTPALMGPRYINEILRMIRQSLPFSSDFPEITLEANPENITESLMQEFAQAGINRISIGLQTLNTPLLNFLGRLHSAEKAVNAVQQTARAGIKNISIDLMYDLPNQNIEIWRDTLARVADLPITHLSLYNLTIEPHTVFFKHQESIKKMLPNEEVSLLMYETAIEQLENMQLKQYEISAFARDNFISNHNVGYWTGREFLGLGPSAFSYMDRSRFRNVAHLNKYSQALRQKLSPIDFDEKLSSEAQVRELLAINIRLKEGVNLNTFQQKNGQLSLETQDTIKTLVKQGLIVQNEKRLHLTQRGILFYDTVATELI
jgi:oxygen-independent coproporphyrinogen-3 oxidase